MVEKGAELLDGEDERRRKETGEGIPYKETSGGQ